MNSIPIAAAVVANPSCGGSSNILNRLPVEAIVSNIDDASSNGDGKLRGYDATSSSIGDSTAFGFGCSIGAADAAEGKGGRSDSSSPVAPSSDRSVRVGAEITPLETAGEKAAEFATRKAHNVMIVHALIVITLCYCRSPVSTASNTISLN